jgi:hypothetical protein
MRWQETQAVLNRITAPDHQMSTEQIRKDLKKCLESLQSDSGFKDFPSGAAMSAVPYEVLPAEQSVEQALKQLDRGNPADMLQHVRDALAHLSKTEDRETHEDSV